MQGYVTYFEICATFSNYFLKVHTIMPIVESLLLKNDAIKSIYFDVDYMPLKEKVPQFRFVMMYLLQEFSLGAYLRFSNNVSTTHSHEQKNIYWPKNNSKPNKFYIFFKIICFI